MQYLLRKIFVAGYLSFIHPSIHDHARAFRQDVSLFTFPMVITAFFSAMMGGLLAPLVVNVAARSTNKQRSNGDRVWSIYY